MIDQTLAQALQKEIPILTAQIRSLYAEFDKKFHLNGAKIPITFGMEPDLLGSYTRGSYHEKEHFSFFPAVYRLRGKKSSEKRGQAGPLQT
jgi:hypothetical protein